MDFPVDQIQDTIPAVFRLPQVPELITVRDDSTEPLLPGQENLIRVGTQITEADW
jgi:hypothetical protein